MLGRYWNLEILSINVIVTSNFCVTHHIFSFFLNIAASVPNGLWTSCVHKSTYFHTEADMNEWIYNKTCLSIYVYKWIQLLQMSLECHGGLGLIDDHQRVLCAPGPSHGTALSLQAAYLCWWRRNGASGWWTLTCLHADKPCFDKTNYLASGNVKSCRQSTLPLSPPPSVNTKQNKQTNKNSLLSTNTFHTSSDCFLTMNHLYIYLYSDAGQRYLPPFIFMKKISHQSKVKTVWGQVWWRPKF